MILLHPTVFVVVIGSGMAYLDRGTSPLSSEFLAARIMLFLLTVLQEGPGNSDSVPVLALRLCPLFFPASVPVLGDSKPHCKLPIYSVAYTRPAHFLAVSRSILGMDDPGNLVMP